MKIISATCLKRQVRFAIAHLLAKRIDVGIHKVFFKAHNTIDNAAWGEFNDPVSNCRDKLMVMGCKEDNFGEVDQAVVESGN